MSGRGFGMHFERGAGGRPLILGIHRFMGMGLAMIHLLGNACGGAGSAWEAELDCGLGGRFD